jgi:hypothetical protein
MSSRRNLANAIRALSMDAVQKELHYQLCYFGVMILKIIQSYLKYMALFIAIV